MKVAMLTAGGLAPCLSAAVANLIIRYNSIDPDVEIIAYKDGFKGLLIISAIYFLLFPEDLALSISSSMYVFALTSSVIISGPFLNLFIV